MCTYSRQGSSHTISLSKDELILLIALIHEGLENMKGKVDSSDLVRMKLDAAEHFVAEFNRSIMVE